MTGLHLVDVIIAVLVVTAFLGALRQRRGVLAGLASAAGTALVCWLVAAAVLVWAPPAARTAVDQSRIVALLPPPVAAVREGGRAGVQLLGHLERGPEPRTP